MGIEMRVVDTKRDSLILPVNEKKIDRREFLIYSTLVSGMTLLPAKRVEAGTPIILSLFARSIIKGIIRKIGTSLSKKFVAKKKPYSSLSKKIQVQIAEEVATDLVYTGINRLAVHQVAKELPEALWTRDNQENLLFFEIENETDSIIETKFLLALVDVKTNKIEQTESKFNVTASPNRKGSFTYNVFKDLPHTGNKKVIGIVPPEIKGLKINSTQKIVVMNSKDIYT